MPRFTDDQKKIIDENVREAVEKSIAIQRKWLADEGFRDEEIDEMTREVRPQLVKQAFQLFKQIMEECLAERRAIKRQKTEDSPSDESENQNTMSSGSTR